MEGFSEPQSNHGSWELDLDNHVIRWSPALYRIHGVSPGEFELTRDAIRPLVHPDDREAYARVVSEAIAAQSPFAFQHRIVQPGGGERVVMVRGAYLEGIDGASPRLVGTTQDVTGRLGDEERLWHLANHDSSPACSTAAGSWRS